MPKPLERSYDGIIAGAGHHGLILGTMARAEEPQDLAGTALFLASDAASFLTGQAVTVNGGATHPWTMVRFS